MADLYNETPAQEEVVDYTALVPHGCSKSRYDQILKDAERLMQENFGSDYIWHRESFNLNHFAFGNVPCLFGSTDFGGCIEDEWVIVWIVVTLTKKHPDLYVRVADSDGEFLLIEAAHKLPNWLTPEIAENRVWINNGKVKVIPSNAFAHRSPSIEEAFSYLKKYPDRLIRDDGIDKAALVRTVNLPRKAIEDNTHRTKVVVPRKVAGILHRFPQYISASTEAFVTRDDSAEKYLSKLTIFPPDTAVECVLKLTRRQFARLVGDPYKPQWAFPGEMTDEKKLGEKIACGMELLARQSLPVKPLTPQIVIKQPDFLDIVADLTERGYFHNHAPGTPEYNVLIRQAIKPYIDARRVANENAYLSVRIRQEAPTNDEISQWGQKTDSLDWLVEGLKGEDENSEMPANLKEMLAKLEEFMGDQKAGLDGIDLDDESTTDDDSSDDDDGDEETVKIDPNDPDISADDFLEFFMKEALKLSPDEMESYRADAMALPTLSRQSRQSLRERAPPITEDNSLPDSPPTAPSSRKGKEKAEDLEASDDDGVDFELFDDDDEEDWEQAEQQLRDHGVLPELSDGPDYEVLHNLLQSVQTGGGVTGPAATLLGQLGVKIPQGDA